MPVFWIALFICWYGLQSCWKLIDKNGRIPNFVVIGLQGIVLIITGVWLFTLAGYLPGMDPISERSSSLPYVAMGVVALLFVLRLFLYRARYFRSDFAGVMVVCLIIVSNQFMLVRVVGNGQRWIEFKYLADWYLTRAGPDEKMVSSMAPVLSLLVPEYKDNFIPIYSIKAEDPSVFIRECRKKNITYVVWDSKLGAEVDSRHYKLFGFENIARLSEPKSIGPYEFVTKIINPSKKDKYVNVFRLRPPAPVAE